MYAEREVSIKDSVHAVYVYLHDVKLQLRRENMCHIVEQSYAVYSANVYAGHE